MPAFIAEGTENTKGRTDEQTRSFGPMLWLKVTREHRERGGLERRAAPSFGPIRRLKLTWFKCSLGIGACFIFISTGFTHTSELNYTTTGASSIARRGARRQWTWGL